MENDNRWRVLQVNTVPKPQLRTTEVSVLDLNDLEDWPQMSFLLDGKFYSYFEDKLPKQYRSFMEGKGSVPQELFPEFIIDQARSIGPRILFNPKVLTTVYGWDLDPERGAKYWRRFATAIQLKLARRELSLMDDPRTPQFRRDLIDELKVIRTELRKKRAVCVEWNLAINLETLSKYLKTFAGNRLSSNADKFIKFISTREQMFKYWLVERGSSTTLADEFMAHRYEYKSPELARQAVMRRQKKNRTELGAMTKPSLRTSHIL
jgi:hypothetical protein